MNETIPQNRLNVAGVVVRTLPRNAEVVRQRLEAIPGVEVHGISDTGNLAITLEDIDDRMAADSLVDVQNTQGVIAASLIYHEIFEEPDAQEATR